MYIQISGFGCQYCHNQDLFSKWQAYQTDQIGFYYDNEIHIIEQFIYFVICLLIIIMIHSKRFRSIWLNRVVKHFYYCILKLTHLQRNYEAQLYLFDIHMHVFSVLCYVCKILKIKNVQTSKNCISIFVNIYLDLMVYFQFGHIYLIYERIIRIHVAENVSYWYLQLNIVYINFYN